eukprot:8947675-Ditylum_brightwellii.AAC.1
MTMGSHEIDFLNPTLKDHNVDTLHLADLDDIDDPFELYHDYARNTTVKPTCYRSNSGSELTEQTRSPGIILILEAENSSANLASPGAVKDTLTGVLEESGLSEGYVVARTEPEHEYVGFDIHLWSSFHKQGDLEIALITAMKGDRKISSSFRIIAGGMFGVSTWMDDEKRRGPSSTEECDAVDDAVTYKAKQISINS